MIKEELPDVDLASLKGMPTAIILYVNNIIEIIVNIKRQCNFGPNPGLLAADQFSRALTYTYASFSSFFVVYIIRETL